MSLRLNVLRGCPIAAMDGAAGVLNDLYLDDRIWTVRYLAIDNGSRRPGRALVRPSSATLRADGTITLALTTTQLKRRIALDTDPHLLGARELTGFLVQAPRGAIGVVTDLLIETDWSIAGVAVWSGNGLPGRHMDLAVEALEAIERAARMVRVHPTGE